MQHRIYVDIDKNRGQIRTETVTRKLFKVFKSMHPDMLFFAKKREGQMCSRWVLLARILVESMAEYRLEWNLDLASQRPWLRVRGQSPTEPLRTSSGGGPITFRSRRPCGRLPGLPSQLKDCRVVTGNAKALFPLDRNRAAVKAKVFNELAPNAEIDYPGVPCRRR